MKLTVLHSINTNTYAFGDTSQKNTQVYQAVLVILDPYETTHTPVLLVWPFI